MLLISVLQFFLPGVLLCKKNLNGFNQLLQIVGQHVQCVTVHCYYPFTLSLPPPLPFHSIPFHSLLVDEWGYLVTDKSWDFPAFHDSFHELDLGGWWGFILPGSIRLCFSCPRICSPQKICFGCHFFEGVDNSLTPEYLGYCEICG